MKLRISRASEAALSLSMAALLWTRRRRVSERASEAYQGIKLCAATAAREGRKEEGTNQLCAASACNLACTRRRRRRPGEEGRREGRTEGPFLRSTKRATCPPPSVRTAAAIRNHATPKVENLPTFPLAGNIASSGDVPRGKISPFIDFVLKEGTTQPGKSCACLSDSDRKHRTS